jgi:small subunit ribosomal protein S17
MADEEKTEETPETPEETAAEETPAAEEPAAEAAPEETAEAAEAPEAEAEADAAPAAEPAAPTTKRAQRAAAKHAEASKRPARSPEERQAERQADRKRKAEQRRRRRTKEREKAKAARGTTAPPPAVHAEVTGRPKVRMGIVVSDKADQTITVRVDIARRHRRYEKIVRSSSTLHAHDPSNDANEGDTVRVIECRPLSKTKRWRLVEVLERAR